MFEYKQLFNEQERPWLKEKINRFGAQKTWAIRRSVNFANAEIHTPYTVELDLPESVNEIQHVREELRGLRKTLGELIEAQPNKIRFSYNTTRSLELVLRTRIHQLKRPLHILATDREYDSMTRIMDHAGCTIETAPLELMPERIATSHADTVFMPHVTHDGLAIVDVERLTKQAREKGTYVIIDAAQSVAHIPVSVEKIGCDALVGCGHKWIGGDTASGFAYLRELDNAENYWFGLPQPYPRDLDTSVLFRDCTVSYSALIHMHGSLKKRTDWKQEFSRIAELGSYARQVLDTNPDVEVLKTDTQPPGMVCFTSNIANAHTILDKKYRIHVVDKGSHYRASFMPMNNKHEIRYLSEALSEIAANK